ncbi:MAG: TMEM175 family protein [Xanthobacteraceae bacterium]
MMVPKHRLDGLTDAVFGVAMTLLVIDLRLPETFHPRDAADLWRALSELSTQFLAYAISFAVLARRWVGLAKLSEPADADRFARWALLHLFLIALIPFSTMLIGRFSELTPAIAIYAANTILAAVVMLRLLRLSGAPKSGDDGPFGLVALVVVALISVGVSLVRPGDAMWAYLLLLLTPLAARWLPKPKS